MQINAASNSPIAALCMPDTVACGTSLEVGTRHAALGLLSQLNAHHPGTGDHSVRVARLMIAMWSVDSTWLGLYETVLLAGLLHDAGKLFVDREILDANRKLTEAELAAMQDHSGQGAALLEELGFADAVVAAARDHHERWSGGGYPTGRPSSQLSPLSRALAAADAFSAMIEPHRAYRRPRTVPEALAEMNACRGTQFDPTAVDLLHAATDRQIHKAGWVSAPESGAGMARPIRTFGAAGIRSVSTRFCGPLLNQSIVAARQPARRRGRDLQDAQRPERDAAGQVAAPQLGR